MNSNFTIGTITPWRSCPDRRKTGLWVQMAARDSTPAACCRSFTGSGHITAGAHVLRRRQLKKTAARGLCAWFRADARGFSWARTGNRRRQRPEARCNRLRSCDFSPLFSRCWPVARLMPPALSKANGISPRRLQAWSARTGSE